MRHARDVLRMGGALFLPLGLLTGLLGINVGVMPRGRQPEGFLDCDGQPGGAWRWSCVVVLEIGDVSVRGWAARMKIPTHLRDSNLRDQLTKTEQAY